jgi:hypothetical protein
MKLEISRKDICKQLIKQLKALFIIKKSEVDIIQCVITDVLLRLEGCFKKMKINIISKTM